MWEIERAQTQCFFRIGRSVSSHPWSKIYMQELKCFVSHVHLMYAKFRVIWGTNKKLNTYHLEVEKSRSSPMMVEYKADTVPVFWLTHRQMVTHGCVTNTVATGVLPVNKITSLQRPWKVLLSFCKRCVKTSWGRQCVEFSLRPQNDLKKRCAGTLTGRSGDVGLLWWRPGNVARKFCFHKNFPGTLSESFVSNRIVCLCSVNVV